MTVSVKSLQKQLIAAIAMVLVAAIAVGSSTYAWFVSNNTVKATTSTISAQSNAPFLMIDKSDITSSSTTAISFTDIASKALYPAQVVKAVGNETYKDASDQNQTMTAEKPLFKSAYASTSSATTELANSRYDVGDASTAVAREFAIKESFKIGTADAKAGSFQNLKVSKVELTSAGTDGLEAAMSVLVVCGDKWAVYKASDNGAVLTEYKDNTSAAGTATDGVLATAIAANTSVNVDVYVFYDGSETKVYTDNLANLTAIGATITFTATPVNTQGTALTNASNAAPSAAISRSGNVLTVAGADVPAGYTATSYIWTKDGVDLNNNSASYTLVTPNDASSANYVCKVTYDHATLPDIVVTSDAFNAAYTA